MHIVPAYLSVLNIMKQPALSWSEVMEEWCLSALSAPHVQPIMTFRELSQLRMNLNPDPSVVRYVLYHVIHITEPTPPKRETLKTQAFDRTSYFIAANVSSSQGILILLGFLCFGDNVWLWIFPSRVGWSRIFQMLDLAQGCPFVWESINNELGIGGKEVLAVVWVWRSAGTDWIGLHAKFSVLIKTGKNGVKLSSSS